MLLRFGQSVHFSVLASLQLYSECLSDTKFTANAYKVSNRVG